MNIHLPERREWLGRIGAAALAALAIPRGAMARAAPSADPAPALLLARDAPAEVDPAGFLVSEKFDGIRAYWDGRRLRLRGGGPIAAPDWFVAPLPAQPLDGELWMGRGQFEALAGAVRRQVPVGDEWRRIRYLVFELPGGAGSFAERAQRLAQLARVAAGSALDAVPQEPVADRRALRRRLEAVVRAGGEGLMLHRADAPYVTGRQPVLLKLKPVQDEEAVVIAHEPGQGRHAGRLGALRVRDASGREFRLGTGFSDGQREEPPAVGSVVTFSYRGRTDRGLPRFASFLRERSP